MRAHPGVLDAPGQGELKAYTVRALVLNVVRSVDALGRPNVDSYDRGDQVLLDEQYAAPYLAAGLLVPVPEQPTRPRTAAEKRAAAKAAESSPDEDTE